MAIQQFRLPDLGEGLTEGDILKWTVAVGDVVEVNDTIAEVETVKAAVELPSPYAGTVAALHAAEGETVPVGTPIISIETGASDPADPPRDPRAPRDPRDPLDQQTDSGVLRPDRSVDHGGAGAAEDLVPALPAAETQMTLVGYGPRAESGGRRRRRAAPPGVTASAGAQVSFNLPPASTAVPARSLPPAEPPTELSALSATAPPATAPPATALPATALPATAPPATAPPATAPLAKPPVRKLAKSLGVDLHEVPATGPNGTISRTDVQSAHTAGRAGWYDDATAPSTPGRVTRVPIKGVRKHTAAAMVASAFTAPHVTEFLTIDMTATMALRDRVAARREFRDVKVSPLFFVAKAVLLAVGNTPEVNARWDDAAQEIVLMHYVNLGIAAATPRGLIVPNIADADALSLLDLARAMAALTETARAGRTARDAMENGTFTITNVGVLGVDTGTPILNPGESAILAFGAVRRQPWVVGTGADERIEPRWVTQLALSFDHRVVDGEQGSRFLAEVGAILTDPALALLAAR